MVWTPEKRPQLDQQSMAILLWLCLLGDSSLDSNWAGGTTREEMSAEYNAIDLTFTHEIIFQQSLLRHPITTFIFFHNAQKSKLSSSLTLEML